MLASKWFCQAALLPQNRGSVLRINELN